MQQMRELRFFSISRIASRKSSRFLSVGIEGSLFIRDANCTPYCQYVDRALVTPVSIETARPSNRLPLWKTKLTHYRTFRGVDRLCCRSCRKTTYFSIFLSKGTP